MGVALVTMVETVDMEAAVEEEIVMATRVVVVVMVEVATAVMVAAATAAVATMTITTTAMETLEVVSRCQSEFWISIQITWRTVSSNQVYVIFKCE